MLHELALPPASKTKGTKDMTYFTKIASVAALAVSLAPFAAQARSGEIGTASPVQHLVRISSAPALHGRVATNTQVPADFATASAAELANISHGNNSAG